MGDIERGIEAKEIIESELWKQAEDGVNSWVLENIKEHWQDKEALHQVASFAVAHDKYRSFFEETIDIGVIAEIELSNKQAESD